MNPDEIIKKVEEFLINKNTQYDSGSIEHEGLRENYQIAGEDAKDYLYVSYNVLTDKTNKYSTETYFVFIEKETLKISYHIGPQLFEKIEE